MRAHRGTGWTALTAAMASVGLLWGIAPATAAENWWTVPDPPDHVGIQAAKFVPSFDDPYSFSATGWNFSVRSTIRPKLVLLIDVPAGHATSDPDTGLPDGWAAGNAFLGVELGARGRGIYSQLGIRFPSASDDRTLPLGYARNTDAHYTDRYVSDYLTFSALLNLGGGEADDATVRFRIEPVLLIPTDDNRGTELLVRASLAAFRGVGPLWIGAGFGSVATPDVFQIEDVDDLLDTEFGLTVEGRRGKLRPGGFVRFPVQGEATRSTDAVYGLNLRWLL